MPHPQIKIVGETPDGKVQAIAVNPDGTLPLSGGSGGGSGGGDASAANQDEQTIVLEDIRDRLPPTNTAYSIFGSVNVTNFPLQRDNISINNFPEYQTVVAENLPLPDGAATESTTALIPARIGNTTDATATGDTGDFSLIALLKRLLSIKLPSALAGDRFKTESQLTSASRVTSFINTTAAGTIAAGANSIAIANIGNAAGTVKGVSLPASSALSFGANGTDTLDAISYSAEGTNFLITTVT